MGTKICWFSNCRIFMYLQVGVYLVFIWCLFWCFGVYSRWNAVKGKSAVNPYAVGVYGVLRNFEKRYKLELITRRLQVQILSPQPKQIPLLIQSCWQRYRYCEATRFSNARRERFLFYCKSPDNQAIHTNKRCILGIFRPSCNAFLIVFIVPPRDLTQHSCWSIVKIPLLVKRLKCDYYFGLCITDVTS